MEKILQEDYEKIALHISFVTILQNAGLSLLKLLAGVIAQSDAMISDAIHSASDVFSTIVVIIGVKISGKESDKEHPYGHERLECVAAILLATILAITGIGIGWSALQKTVQGNYDNLEIPGLLASIAAIVSWHHRSDSLSSIGALIGIAGARFGFPILDPVASLIICVFIEKAAFDIFMDAVDKMVDKACDEETEDQMRQCVLRQEGVQGIDLLQTRTFGNKIYVDLEISAHGEISLNEAHEIAENVHDAIEHEFAKVKHIMVHVNPMEV